jgi:cardiolipin synthase
MLIKDWKKEIFTIPNLLSFFRLILIPVYMIVYLRAGEKSDYIIAGVILTMSCLTDMVDGKIARRFNMITTFGKFLDPLADKLTQFALLLCLAIRYKVLWSVFSLFVLKELFQLFAGILAAKHGYILKGALFSGKVCTTILFLSLVIMVLFPNIRIPAIDIIAMIDGVFLMVAFADYFITYLGKKSRFQPLDDTPSAGV